MTIYGTRPVREPPRLYELWELLRTRLSTPTMMNILNNGGIYVPGDNMPTEEGDRSAPWGRLVVAPVVPAFPTGDEQLGRHRLVPFLVRVDYNRPAGARWDVLEWIEAAHAETFRLLQAWLPDTAMKYATMEFPLHREGAPMPAPLWDEQGAVWYVSALYHAFVSPKEIA